MCDERPRADLLVSRNRTAHGVANKPQVQLNPQRRRTATLQEASRPQRCLAGELKTKAKTTKEAMLKEMNPRTGKTSPKAQKATAALRAARVIRRATIAAAMP